ncbi:MAG TPA: peptidylprolyl isomerase [Candidatus Binatia bacterium]|nr:peptidylprolyl isomerase [Candidatus Binatia bacterium]
MSVQDDVVVSIDYTLRLEDGEVIDSSEGRAPLQYLQGQGQIVPGLERELYGMNVGDEKEVTVSAEEGYGDYDEERLQQVPLDAFPEDMELEEGMSVRMRDVSSGQLFDATIDDIDDDDVTLDFNHPLAGETLIFDIKIVNLREASAEELQHGHAHDGNHAH